MPLTAVLVTQPLTLFAIFRAGLDARSCSWRSLDAVLTVLGALLDRAPVPEARYDCRRVH